VAITFRCACGAVYTVDDAQVGVLFHCEACGVDMPVPSASTDAPAPASDRPRGSDDLVAQMRAARQDGAGGSRLGDLAAAGRRSPGAPGARPRGKPLTAHQRASHHIGFKQLMWKPVLGVGLVCALFASYCLLYVAWNTLMAATPGHPAGMPEGFLGKVSCDFGGNPLKDAQGNPLFDGGKVTKVTKGTADVDLFTKLADGSQRRLVVGDDGTAGFAAPGAGDGQCERGIPSVKGPDGFDIPLDKADADPDYRAFRDASLQADPMAGRTGGYIGFGAAFAVVAALLIVLAFWMRRHVAMVAGATAGAVAGASGAATAAEPEDASSDAEPRDLPPAD